MQRMRTQSLHWQLAHALAGGDEPLCRSERCGPEPCLERKTCRTRLQVERVRGACSELCVVGRVAADDYPESGQRCFCVGLKEGGGEYNLGDDERATSAL